MKYKYWFNFWTLSGIFSALLSYLLFPSEHVGLWFIGAAYYFVGLVIIFLLISFIIFLIEIIFKIKPISNTFAQNPYLEFFRILGLLFNVLALIIIAIIVICLILSAVLM